MGCPNKQTNKQTNKCLLCRLDLFRRRHDHHEAVEKDCSDNYKGEHGVNQNVNGHPPNRTEGRQAPAGIRGGETEIMKS